VEGGSVIDDAGADDPEAQGQVRQHAADQAKQALVLDWVRLGRVSVRKGADLLGLGYRNFLDVLTAHRVPVCEYDEEISITRNGRAAAVFVSHDEFESWKETAAVLADPEFGDQIRKGMKALRARRATTFRGKDLDRLLRDVR
jgi:PHD/YefM family antitoxin component YafN of YafNO toxin-antitoxin module